jgi:hypothetical protein
LHPVTTEHGGLNDDEGDAGTGPQPRHISEAMAPNGDVMASPPPLKHRLARQLEAAR